MRPTVRLALLLCAAALLLSLAPFASPEHIAAASADPAGPSATVNVAASANEDGLLAHYAFDGDLADSSPNGWDGWAVGALTYAPGVYGQAASFTGANWVEVASAQLPLGQAARTLCLWGKSTDGQKPGHLANWGRAIDQQAFGLILATGLRWGGYGHGHSTFDTISGIPVDTSWHFLCVTYDGAAMRVYVDGALAAQRAMLLNTVGSTLYIGTRPDYNYPFDGLIDDLSIYNRALSNADVWSLYESNRADAGGPYSVLVGQSVTLSGTAIGLNDDLLSFAWDLDGDGSFETPGQQVTFSAAGRQPGVQPVSLRVCDAQGACFTAGTSIVIASVLRITTASTLPTGTVQAPYSAAMTAEGGVAPYVWSVAGGALPPGLSLHPASGIIGGTPLTAGTWRLRVGLADAAGTMATSDLLVRVAAPAGILWAWGWNGSGQLGDGTVVDRPTPIAETGLAGVFGVGAGAAHSVALRDDGTVWAWGYGRNAELGAPAPDTCIADDSRPCRKTPAPLPNLNAVTELSAGAYHTLARRADGSLWAWGFNGYGQIGAPAETTCSAGVACNYAPVQVQGLSDVVAFAGGHMHSLALKADGTVWAWGGNFAGQLGAATTETCQFGAPCARSPLQVGGLSDIVAIGASPTDGGDYSLALRADGTVWAWGANDHGQLGAAATSTCAAATPCNPNPSQVDGLSDVVAVAAGAWHGLALRADGTVWAWGANGEGALGDGSLTSRATPAQVPGLGQVVAIAAGQHSSLALKADGTVWAWGRNANGQLGDGSFTRSPQPVQVQGLHDVVAIRAGNAHGLAVSRRPVVPALRIVTASPLPGGTVGEPYSTVLEATGGVAPYTWSVAAGDLPPGLTLDAASGTLSGVPTTAGTFSFTIMVTDSAGASARSDFGLDQPPSQGSAGGQYVQPVTITPPGDGGSGGGGAPATCSTYTVVSGALPPGLSLDPATGVLSGTPEDGGDYTVTIGCQSSTGQSATKQFTIRITNPAPVLTSLSPDQATAGGVGLTLTLRGNGFVRGSTARWAGSDRPTTYVSPGELRAEISAQDLATAGSAEVRVFNAEPGGGASNPMTFVIIAPNQPPTLALPAPQTVQYSDSLATTITATDPDHAGAELSFSATGLPAELTLADNGDGSATIAGVAQAAAGTYKAQVNVADPEGLGDTGTLAISVAPEDATISYSGDTSAIAHAPLTLRAQVAEVADGSPGDLSRASVVFVVISGAGTRTNYGPAGTTAGGEAIYTLTAGLPAGEYTVVATLEQTGGFYRAPDSAPARLSIQIPPPPGPTCAGLPATIVGTAGNDRITGTPGNDVIVGLAGNDRIEGGKGNDIICAGAGDDRVWGGKGDDQLWGEGGSDRLWGDTGDDQLWGGEGDDRLDGGKGDYDRLFGGDGKDRLDDEDGVNGAHGGLGDDDLEITLRAGWRSTSGQARFDGKLSGGYGDDSVTLTIAGHSMLFINISGDERDQPSSPLEGRHDRLTLRGAPASPSSVIIKFERR